MLFLLFSSLADEVSPFNVFRYQTSRTGLAIITALIFVFLFGPRIISLLKVTQGRGQPIRSDDAPRRPAQPLCLGGAIRDAGLRCHRLL